MQRRFGHLLPLAAATSRLPRRVASGITLVAAAIGTACGEPAPQPGALRVKIDSSAGVPVVRSIGSPPTWTSEPIATVGTDPTGELEFGTVRSVLLDRRGSLYVVDPGLVRVSLFDSAGSFVKHIGRRGSAPGEYVGPYSIASVHDSIALFDPHSSRISFLDGSGRWARQWTVPMNTGGQAVRLYRAPPDGFWAYATRIDASGIERVFVRYSADGPQDTVSAHATSSPRPSGVSCLIPRGISFYPDPLSKQSLTVPLPSGEVAIAQGAEYRITIIGRAGDTTRIIERAVEPAVVTDEDWQAEEVAWREWRDRVVDEKCDRETLRRPDRHPIIEWLVLDDRGLLWVATRTVVGRAFDVFGPNGTLVATVIGLPPVGGIDPSIAGDRIALVVEDPLGRETVQVHRVRRR